MLDGEAVRQQRGLGAAVRAIRQERERASLIGRKVEKAAN